MLSKPLSPQTFSMSSDVKLAIRMHLRAYGEQSGSIESLNCRRVVTASKLFLLIFSASNLTKQKKSIT